MQMSRAGGAVVSATVLVAALLSITGVAGAAAATKPGVVGGLQVTGKSGHDIAFAWTAPSTGDPVTSYDVRWSADRGKSWHDQNLDGTATSDDLTGLTPGTDYLVTVAPVNDAGTGPAAYLGGAVQLAAGQDHLCARDANGVVSCWGERQQGGIGDGKTTGYASLPVHPIGLADGVKDIAGTASTDCAVTSGGDVPCWGENYMGVATGSWPAQGTGYGVIPWPVSSPATTGAAEVASGAWESCARYPDNSAQCWGDTATTFNDVQEVAGALDPCALTASGDVTCTYSSQQTDDKGLSGAVQFSLSDEHGCAVISDGTVQCWGDNEYGQLGAGDTKSGYPDFVPRQVVGIDNAVQVSAGVYSSCALLATGTVDCWGITDGADGTSHASRTTVPVPVSGLAGAVAVSLPGGGSSYGPYGQYYCALLQTGAIHCWGTEDFGIATGVIGGYDLLQPGVLTDDPPAAPTAVAVSGHPSSSSMDLTWTEAADGGSPATDFRAESSSDGGQTWSEPMDLHTARLKGAVSGLTTGSQYVFRLAAFRDGAWSDWSAPTQSPALAAGAPAAPKQLTVTSQSGNSADLQWQAPDDNGQPITGYRIELSTNGGTTWSTVSTATGTSCSITGVPSSTLSEVRVRAVNDMGLGAPSASADIQRDGSRTQKFTIETSDGEPVTEAHVTWSLRDGSASSAQPLVSNDRGLVTFGRVVVGQGSVHVTGGHLPDGSTVTGHWLTPLGTDSQVLRLPAEPTQARREATVEMPNGVPVLEAEVAVTGGLTGSERAGDRRVRNPGDRTFTFTTSRGASGLTATTDESGRAVLSGYLQNDVVSANVTYSDGELRQRVVSALVESPTVVKLAYMPWLTEEQQAEQTASGAHYAVRVSMRDPNSGANSSERSAVSSAAASRGATVTLLSPAGASVKCRGAKLQGTVRPGHPLRLVLCPRISGTYRIASSGAVPPAPLTLHVKGAPALAPRSLRVAAPGHGRAALRWSAPSYAGGARVTGYRVSYRRAGVKNSARTATVRGHRLLLRRLKENANWQFSVAAVTKYGVGQATTAAAAIA